MAVAAFVPLALPNLYSMDEFSTPFDEFEHPSGIVPALRRGILARWIQAGFRGVSFASLWIAILTASFLIARHAWLWIVGSQPEISLKSAIPLIAIGVSYACLTVTLRRTLGQHLFGILMGLAFALWGLEQFLTDREVISLIDDIVVFLFVADMSIVIRKNFVSCAGERQIRKACFPVVKTIETFNFAARPSIDESLFRALLQGKYIERRENVIIVGNPGTGKTHLATALGYAACRQGKQVLFTTASALVSDLIDAHGSRRLRQFHRRIDRLDLLIIDDIGYMRFSEPGAQLLFEVLRAGYERMSLVITTTIPLEKWAEIFESETEARAAVDRISDRGHLLEATGDSYRRPGRKAVVTPQFRAC
jgi:DNA replication protein DnaC